MRIHLITAAWHMEHRSCMHCVIVPTFMTAMTATSRARNTFARGHDSAGWFTSHVVRRFLRVVLITVLGVGTALCQPQRPQCTSSSNDPRVLSLEVEKQVSAGELHTAMACSEGVISIAKHSPRGYELAAKVCTLGGDLSCCSHFCQLAWELRSNGRSSDVKCRSVDDLEALLLCGNCYASAEKWAQALERYSSATTCAASATAPPTSSSLERARDVEQRAEPQGADRMRMAEALANAYNNMGNVLRLQVCC